MSDKSYEIGKFYLVGSVLKFVRHGDPLVIEDDFTPDEAAEYVANLDKYGKKPKYPTGVRIFTNNRKPKRKAQR